MNKLPTYLDIDWGELEITSEVKRCQAIGKFIFKIGDIIYTRKAKLWILHGMEDMPVIWISFKGKKWMVSHDKYNQLVRFEDEPNIKL